MSTVLMQEQVGRNTKPEWVSVAQVQKELGLSRYLLKRLREKYQLPARRAAIDRRLKLIDLTVAKRCLQKEMASVQVVE